MYDYLIYIMKAKLVCYSLENSDHLIDELLLGYSDGWYIFPVKDEYGNIVTAVARAGKTLQKAKDLRYMLPNGAPVVVNLDAPRAADVAERRKRDRTRRRNSYGTVGIREDDGFVSDCRIGDGKNCFTCQTSGVYLSVLGDLWGTEFFL